MTAADVHFNLMLSRSLGAIMALTFRNLKQNNSNQRVIRRRKKTRCIAWFPCDSTSLVIYISVIYQYRLSLIIYYNLSDAL